MKKWYFLMLLASFCVLPCKAQKKPAVVILTAGQSNTDGRVSNKDLPAEIKKDKYQYCQWSFGSSSQLSEGYDIKLMLWHQGESDRQQAQNYYHNLKQVISYVRQYLVEKTGKKKYAQLPIVLGGIAHQSKQWSQGVEDAQKKLANEDANIYLVEVPNASLGSDVLHFNAEGATELGTKMYQLIKRKKLLK